MDILGSLDVSVRGITKLLWPQLLLYVVPAQYTGMLIPVSRCVQALAERGDLTVRDIEELDPHFLNSMFQGPLLTPQTLLARLLVVAGSPFAGSELQAAALLLMRNLHSRIHRAVGATWAAEIPLLLQCLEGKVLVGRERRRQGRFHPSLRFHPRGVGGFLVFISTGVLPHQCKFSYNPMHMLVADDGHC
ncbi:maestro heat-like repeat-containing protein family member 2B [Coturnix japonica]|uniref:maestro heat-like repeat-containing protein family member 2B n=1 Tax=Coturnix japonica TaxID=93934 RepID=UPI000777AC33|nr:maestro heat-like repeat-containing protein family member 2B [Coturnix japonica]